jgi:hypothetical protein
MVTLAQKHGTDSFYIERYYNNPTQYEQPFHVKKLASFIADEYVNIIENLP